MRRPTELEKDLARWEAGDFTAEELQAAHPSSEVDEILAEHARLTMSTSIEPPSPAGAWMQISERIEPRGGLLMSLRLTVTRPVFAAVASVLVTTSGAYALGVDPVQSGVDFVRDYVMGGFGDEDDIQTDETESLVGDKTRKGDRSAVSAREGQRARTPGSAGDDKAHSEARIEQREAEQREAEQREAEEAREEEAEGAEERREEESERHEEVVEEESESKEEAAEEADDKAEDLADESEDDGDEAQDAAEDAAEDAEEEADDRDDDDFERDDLEDEDREDDD